MDRHVNGIDYNISFFFKTWVARLKMKVYKGIWKHSFSRSPAMNFDRSAVSFRLNIGNDDKTNRM